MSIILRRAKKTDVDAVFEIERTSFKDPWSKRAFQYELQLPPSLGLFYVAEEEGQVKGYMVLHVFEESVHIINIAVKSTDRNRGIGTMLLKKAEDVAIERNIPLLVLEVRENNTIAIRLYKKFGFKVMRKIEKYYSDGENALVMVKEICDGI